MLTCDIIGSDIIGTAGARDVISHTVGQAGVAADRVPGFSLAAIAEAIQAVFHVPSLGPIEYDQSETF